MTASSILPIPVSTHQIGNLLRPAINARDLHRYLEMKVQFVNWIQYWIRLGKFQLHHDFEVFKKFLKNPSGGRPQKEYIVSLRMAYHLANTTTNDKGFLARDYFFECLENLASQPQLTDFKSFLRLSDPKSLAQFSQECSNRLIELASEMEDLTSKAQFQDDVSNAENCHTVSEVAKMFGLGRVKMFQMLREKGLILHNSTLPSQSNIDKGYFRVVEKTYRTVSGGPRLYAQTYVTGKGLVFLQRMFRADILKLESLVSDEN